MTTAHGDDTSAERPLVHEPTGDEIAGLDWDDDRDDVDDGPDIISADDDEEEEGDDERRLQLRERVLTLYEFMDEQEGRA